MIINPFAFGSATSGSLLLDISGLTGAVAAYSMSRKLRSAYAGDAFRVVRTNDSAEFDIGFDGDDVDRAYLESLIGGGGDLGISVMTLYDQSGSGLDLVAEEAAAQTVVNAGGEVQEMNGKLLFFTGGYSGMATASYAAELNTAQASAMIVTDKVTCGPHLYARDETPDLGGWSLSLFSDEFFGVYGEVYYSTPGPNSVQRLHDNYPDASAQYLQVGIFGNTAANCRNRINGIESGASIQGTPANMPTENRKLYLAGQAGGFVFFGNFQEAVVWPSTLTTTDILNIENSTNTHYSIY